MILSMTNLSKLKCDLAYSTSNFGTLLARRHDADDKLKIAFDDFLAIIGGDLSGILVESGMAFEKINSFTMETETVDEANEELVNLSLDGKRSRENMAFHSICRERCGLLPPTMAASATALLCTDSTTSQLDISTACRRLATHSIYYIYHISPLRNIAPCNFRVALRHAFVLLASSFITLFFAILLGPVKAEHPDPMLRRLPQRHQMSNSDTTLLSCR